MSLINNKIEIIAKEFFKGNSSKFARDLGVTPTTISNYRNETAPKFDFIMDLVNKLGINWEWLIHDRGDMINKNGPVEVQEPAEPYNLQEQLNMYREYVDTLKENNKLKEEKIREQQEKIEKLIRKINKMK
jgi:transcriptional regulator with XRE-family HTH domain